jgi:glycosyltransferase involved in cell wall biosynthesis
LEILQSRFRGALRWVELPILTLGLLRRVRPEILFVQSPSLALSSFAVLWRPFFSYLLVIHAHNEGVRPFDRQGAFVRWLTRRLLRKAGITIVTNEALATDVRNAGGRPLVLPDALPVPPDAAVLNREQGRPIEIAVVATYRPDEPIAAIMAAAHSLPDVRFEFSGDIEKFKKLNIDVPDNVHLTGFLADRDYWQLLNDAAVVCDLTLKSDCLVCGAYEALALGKAMVLSDNPATREIFGTAAELTGNSTEAIVTALQRAMEKHAQLEASARDLAETYQARWATEATAAWHVICVAAKKVRSNQA